MTPRICTPRFWYQVSNAVSSAVEDLRAASSFNGIRQKIARISTKEIMRFFLYRKLPFSSATYQPGEFKFQHTEFKATMMIDQFLDAKWPPLSSLFSTREKSKNPLRLTYCLLGLLIYQDTLLMLFQAPINTFDHYKDSFQVKFFKKREEKKSDNCHRHYENDLAEQCCNFATPNISWWWCSDVCMHGRNASKHVIFDPLLKQLVLWWA